jgi:hypothetical protein
VAVSDHMTAAVVFRFEADGTGKKQHFGADASRTARRAMLI